MTGANYWIVVGPIVFFVTLGVWVLMLLVLGNRDRRYRREKVERKGPVAGAIIEGDVPQVNPGHLVDLPDVEQAGSSEPPKSEGD